MTREVLCKDCGAKKSKKGLYCKKCGYKHRIRPSGLKYELKVKNRAWFKKGLIPWNAGTKGLIISWNKGTRGLCRANRTSFTSEDVLGSKNKRWKGEGVGYGALHRWLKRNYSWSDKCEICGSTRTLQLASKNYIYDRDPENWFILCRKCHDKHDRTRNWGYATKTFNLRRYKNA